LEHILWVINIVDPYSLLFNCRSGIFI